MTSAGWCTLPHRAHAFNRDGHLGEVHRQEIDPFPLLIRAQLSQPPGRCLKWDASFSASVRPGRAAWRLCESRLRNGVTQRLSSKMSSRVQSISSVYSFALAVHPVHRHRLYRDMSYSTPLTSLFEPDSGYGALCMFAFGLNYYTYDSMVPT